MADYTFSPGSLEPTIYFTLSTGESLSGGSARYVRRRAAAVSFLSTELAAADSAYSAGKWKLVHSGGERDLWRLDLPTAAVAVGVESVEIQITSAGALNAHVRVELRPQAAAANVDDDHRWDFHDKDQLTSPIVVSEVIGFNALVAMRWATVIPAESVIDTVVSTTITPATGGGVVQPTVASVELGLDLKEAHPVLDCRLATAGTYTITQTVRTSDNQQFTRKFTFELSA